ncbi:uncharacterized protein LOC106466426 [Limulus polyphemus]|uniref:Uncharacterized protein LOC106466426 n=1 Tax=Limulus polyphemus TaxID=6850 RepID=A0ABM1T2N9_LIMPO|nr:uncharacterized protein LOC106466426 [Limulus polyphemus]XP_022250144.1 uncharacterized protein LOC106466426 [Limulus polyphemus]XP_022250145.1 uncharacterized protein LOC106466426 [Limulus polyphemus]
MRVCAASSCKSISELSSGLTFHPLPKDEFLRDQWIDLLGIDDSKITDQTRVCSLHFKPKDFVNFKRNLKTGSIPSLYLSKEKSVPIVDDIAKNNDNSNEFDGEEEKKEESLSATDKDSAKDGSQIVTLQVKEEEKPVRRASRKAALLAAEKIQRTVKEYGLVEGVRSQSPEPRRDSSISMRMKLSQEFHMALLKNGAPKVAQKSSSGKSSIRVGYSYTGQNELYMECFEEVLSPVQVAAYHQAQQEYDKVMKYILSRRASKSEKVRIIYTSHDGEVLNTVGDSEIRLTNPSTNTGNICQKNITVISDTAAERSDPVQMKLQMETAEERRRRQNRERQQRFRAHQSTENVAKRRRLERERILRKIKNETWEQTEERRRLDAESHARCRAYRRNIQRQITTIDNTFDESVIEQQSCSTMNVVCKT